MTRYLFLSLLILATSSSQEVRSQSREGTFVTVPGGKRVEVITDIADVRIEVWDRTDVQVDAEHSSNIQVEVKSGSTVEIQEFRSPRAVFERNEYVVRVPAKTIVYVNSNDGNISVTGIRADVIVQVINGAVYLNDVIGNISVDSSIGDITIEKAIGNVVLDTSAGTIIIKEFEGDVVVELQAGMIVMQDVRAERLKATTLDGNILFEGKISRTGSYDLASNHGSITLVLSGPVSAVVSVGTMKGEFQTDFDLGGVAPVIGELFSFVLGAGESRIDLVTFSGAIKLMKAKGVE